MFTHISIFRCLTSGQEFEIPDTNKKNNLTNFFSQYIGKVFFRKRNTFHLLMDANVEKSLQS